MDAIHPGVGRVLLDLIQDGMAVRDASGAGLGTVRQVYLGGEDLSEIPIAPGSALANVPDELRGRLARHGFVEIATGLLHANLYATTDQLASVDDGGVALAVERDALARK